MESTRLVSPGLIRTDWGVWLLKHSSHQRGAEAEYQAAAWYLGLGCNVFFPASSHARCDFVIDRGGSLLKIQVKHAFWKAQGERQTKYLCATLTRAPTTAYEKGDWDLLFVTDGARHWEIPFAEVAGVKTLYLDREGDAPPRKKTAVYNANDWRVN